MGEIVFPGNKSYGAVAIRAFGSLVNGDTITIGDKVYEFRTSGSPAPGHVGVTVGASDVLTITALIAAIIANPPSVAVDVYVDPVDAKVMRIEAHDHGTAGNMAFSASMTGATNTIDQTSGFLLGGEAGSLKHHDSGRYTVTQMDVDAANIMIPTKLQAPKILSIQTFDSSGKKKADTNDWTASSNRIKGSFTGGTDPVAGDVIAWSARD